MITGEYITYQRIKPDAEPVDNVNKYAWADEDYETVTEWHEFTPDELRDRAAMMIDGLKTELRETETAFIDFLARVAACTDPLRFVATFINEAKSLAGAIAERAKIREQIQEIEKTIGGE